MLQFKRRWMGFVHALGRVQTSIILFLIYVFVLGPTWFVLWIVRRSDLLAMKKKANGTGWSSKPPVPTDIERCERQF